MPKRSKLAPPGVPPVENRESGEITVARSRSLISAPYSLSRAVSRYPAGVPARYLRPRIAAAAEFRVSRPANRALVPWNWVGTSVPGSNG